jgi:acetylornithine deacetylase/succinyl-diaminopimelate desuccinylase-like protein
VSKSDVATFAFALLSLREAGAALGGTVELHLTYDEEVGGEIGPRRLLAQGLSKPDFAIVPGFSYQVVTAHNGCLHLEVTVGGRSAHAALPKTGVDALRSATAILSVLYAENDSYDGTISHVPGIGSPSLTVGLIEGGVNTNVVPDRIIFRVDRRMIPEEQPAEVESRLRQLIGDAKGHPGISIEIRRVLLAAPMRPVAGTERLARIVAGHAKETIGQQIDICGVPLYADGRHYAAQGIPTVMYGAGPRSLLEANAHRADERVALNDLGKATKVIALSVAELLSHRTASCSKR